MTGGSEAAVIEVDDTVPFIFTTVQNIKIITNVVYTSCIGNVIT